MMLKLCRTFVRLLESNKSLFGFSNFKIDQNSLSHDSVKCHSNMYETRNENSSEEGFFHISPKHVEANDDLKSADSHTKMVKKWVKGFRKMSQPAVGKTKSG